MFFDGALQFFKQRLFTAFKSSSIKIKTKTFKKNFQSNRTQAIILSTKVGLIDQVEHE